MPLNKIIVFKAFESVSTAASGTNRSQEVDLSNYDLNGFFSIQLTVTGTGTATITIEQSNDGSNWLTPTGTSAIATTFGASSGPGSDGKDIVSFTPIMTRYMRFLITEAGGAAAVVVTGTVVMQ